MHTKRIVLFFGFLLALGSYEWAYADLKSYVNKPDDSYHYEIVERTTLDKNDVLHIKMQSQTWQGIPWTHWVTVIVPNDRPLADKALLIVAGGDNTDTAPNLKSTEARVGSLIAMNTHSVVAVVRQIPNQPLFDGRKEDGIIAYTFDKFLKGEGDDWPLLLPMVKSAVRGMDTVQSILKQEYNQPINGFVVTGGSKRGWTTWLSAVADSRVVAIMPMIIDTLNMGPQMRHQFATYGGYSEQIEDYTEYQLQQRMQSPEGQSLLKVVDPFSYREQLTLPKLIILGANDPYWTVDAANLYFPDLKGPKYLYYQANTEHDINPNGIATATQFYASILKGTRFPSITWEKTSEGELIVRWEQDGGKALLWQASSPNRDFRKSPWTSTTLTGDKEVHVRMDAPKEGWVAYYVEVQWPGDFGMPYGVCTQMNVLPDTMPTQGRTYDVAAAPQDKAAVN
jgi:PhoPQ-activated pathogenicity-related protein